MVARFGRYNAIVVITFINVKDFYRNGATQIKNNCSVVLVPSRRVAKPPACSSTSINQLLSGEVLLGSELKVVNT